MKGKLPKISTQGFSKFVVGYRWVFIGIFIGLIVLSCIGMAFNKVNYDLSSALPKDSNTSRALSVLSDEFDDKGMLYVEIEQISEADVATWQNTLSAIDGVDSVIYDPTTGFVDGCVLFTVTLDDYDATDEAYETTDRIVKAISDKTAYITGQSAYTYYTRQETENSIMKIGIVIVFAILLMLLFTSRTYFELVPMIIVFGTSILLNMGTNFLFNGISYISNLVSLVLQLALSIDYSVILLHRYMEEKETESDAKRAAVAALGKGTSEILSSSFTTIAGLASLLLMTLPIGVEIGLALAKSIVLSLVSVLFLMPALLVVFDKPLEKTKHKSFVPNVTRPARAIIKARKVIVPVFLVVMILAGVGQFYNTYAFDMNSCSKIVESRAAVKEHFGTLNSFVVVVPGGNYEKERELAEKISSYEIIDSVTSLSTIKVVDGIYLTDSFSKTDLTNLFTELTAGTDYASFAGLAGGVFDDYVEEYLPTENSDTVTVPLVDLLGYVNTKYSALLGDYGDLLGQLGQLVTARASLEGEHYSRMTFNIDGAVESDETFAFVENVQKDISEAYDEFYITGESVVCYDMSLNFPRDNTYVSICIVAFILAILLLTFKNFALPVILTAAIQGGIWINFVIPFLSNSSVSFIGYLIISAVQMGATIDYAIVLTSRYQSLRTQFADRYEAMAVAQNAVFPTIITSGIILTVTGFTLALASSGVVAQMGSLLGFGTAVSMAVVLFVLPSLLLVSEKVSDKADFALVFGKLLHSKSTSDEELSQSVTEPEQSHEAAETDPLSDETDSSACTEAAENTPTDTVYGSLPNETDSSAQFLGKTAEPSQSNDTVSDPVDVAADSDDDSDTTN